MADVTLTAQEQAALMKASSSAYIVKTYAVVEAIVTARVAAALGEVEARLNGVQVGIHIEMSNPLTDEARGFRDGALAAIEDALAFVREVRGEVGC